MIAALWLLALASIARAGDWYRIGGCDPPARSNHAMAYSDARYRVYLHGGVAFGSANNPTRVHDDLWEFDPLTGTWSQLLTTGIRPAMCAHTMIYDDVRDKLIIFGGYVPVSPWYLRDVWEFDFGARVWSRVSPAGGSVPVARSSHAACYDAARHRMMLYGGYSGNSVPLNSDLWEYDPAGRLWTQIPLATGPGGLNSQGMAFNPLNGETWMFGGVGGVVSNALWRYSPVSQTWSHVFPGGSLPAARMARESFLFDADGNRFLVFGGSDFAGGFLGDTWEYRVPDAVWSRLSAASPALTARGYHAMAGIPLPTRVLLFGGADGTQANLGDACLWSETAVAMLTTCSPIPSPTPSPTVSPTPTLTATPTGTPTPTLTPTATPTLRPSPVPTNSPSPSPTLTPVPAPSDTPSPSPTPSPEPTVAPFQASFIIDGEFAAFGERALSVTVTLANPGGSVPGPVLLYSIAEIFGTFYTLPGFEEGVLPLAALDSGIPAGLDPLRVTLVSVPIPEPLPQPVTLSFHAAIVDARSGALRGSVTSDSVAVE